MLFLSEGDFQSISVIFVFLSLIISVIFVFLSLGHLVSRPHTMSMFLCEVVPFDTESDFFSSMSNIRSSMLSPLTSINQCQSMLYVILYNIVCPCIPNSILYWIWYFMSDIAYDVVYHTYYVVCCDLSLNFVIFFDKFIEWNISSYDTTSFPMLYVRHCKLCRMLEIQCRTTYHRCWLHLLCYLNKTML